MTTWKITVTEMKPGTGLHTTGSASVTDTLLDLVVRNQRLAAATLRALADELDPPTPPRPVMRLRGPAVERVGNGNIPASLGVRRTGPNPRITPDGCGPEHTFTGSCALTPPRRD